MADSEITPIATSSTSASSASTITAAHTGRRQGEGQHDSLGAATAVPVIDKAQVKIIVKDAKDYVIVETLTTCGFHDSSSRLTVVQATLTDACSSVIAEDHLVKLWTDENISSLYKTIITPMSTLLNRFKQCAQDLVENLYKLRMSIWTDPTVQADHNKSTVEFLIGNNSLNFIFGDPVRMADSTCCFGINSFTGGLSDVQSWLYFSADPLQMLGLCFVFTRSKVPYILKEDDTKFLGDGYEFVSGKDEMIVEGKAGYVLSFGEMLYSCRTLSCAAARRAWMSA
ncbi:hypothetical protein DFH29DRAFT_1005039 [Suillus ampliporus]|nr:hypothetical protein DFH29DRAFT_1005039 [Suillus ampliporus]